MPSNATEEDKRELSVNMQVKTLIDLRSVTELKEDESLKDGLIYQGFDSVIWTRSSGAWLVDGEGNKISRITPSKRHRIKKFFSNNNDDEDSDDNDDGNSNNNNKNKNDNEIVRGNERHFVAIMDERKYLVGTLQRIRKRTVARLVLTSPALASKRVRTKSKAVIMDTINEGGLPVLNDLILQMARRGIRYVLETIADPERHPVVIYCTAGKDRTGVLTAILLSYLGVEDELIVGDYEKSKNVYKEMDDRKAMVGALQQ